jgi:serine/threonine protein kinase
VVMGRVGTWELVRAIGQGQLAMVYQGRPSGGAADRLACHAVKVLRPEWQDDARGLATLAREVQVSRRVASPHLVPILAAQLDARPYFTVMPLLSGGTLAARIAEQIPCDLSVAFWICRQVAQALATLDASGWAHMDVKPSNIFVSPSGHVTLIDLGFARAAGEIASAARRPVVGTMQYLAPEMIYSSDGGDVRSDIYSLGVTLFEILTGHLPFDADNVADLARQHRQELPAEVRGMVPHVPTRAARLVQRMLAKDPLRRPAPIELVDRLAALEIETFAERHWVAA